MDTTDDSSLELGVVEIASDGDVLLDVTFETSNDTLKAARKATKPRPGQKASAPAHALKPSVRIGYRVQLSVLRQKSKYFDNLFSDTRFAEAKSIAAAFEQLSLRNIKPSDASVADLPAVRIHEDDEATKLAGQEVIFGHLLRILHEKPLEATAGSKPWTMHQVATLAVLADRFDCTLPVSRSLSTLKFKWPTTPTTLPREDRPMPSLSRTAEETLRQKILVSWLLDQPPKMHTSTRELILYGSRKWSVYPDEDDTSSTAAWWDLPDDLERELQHRRDCILNTIASIPRHFLRLYTSKQRQCKLGYDSSASCDSFQLGEMVKFLFAHNLLSLGDFSPASLDTPPLQDHFATVDINHIISVLKQCPSYQIDKNHTNCGLRTRISPIVAYVQTMLSSNVVAPQRTAWKKARDTTTWLPSEAADDGGKKGGEEKVFLFTRSLAGDQRLRYEGVMAADRMARALFTADRWEWTPED